MAAVPNLDALMHYYDGSGTGTQLNDIINASSKGAVYGTFGRNTTHPINGQYINLTHGTGNGGLITLPYNGITDMGNNTGRGSSGNFTIRFWVYNWNSSSNNNVIMEQSGGVAKSPQNPIQFLWLNAGAFTNNVYWAGYESIRNSITWDGACGYSQWCHVVFTVSGNAVNSSTTGNGFLYINGASVGAVPLRSSNETPYTLNNLTFGWGDHEGIGNSSSDMMFDEIGIWNSSFSGADVLNDFNGGVGSFYGITGTSSLRVNVTEINNGKPVSSINVTVYNSTITLSGISSTGSIVINGLTTSSFYNVSITNPTGYYYNTSISNYLTNSSNSTNVIVVSLVPYLSDVNFTVMNFSNSAQLLSFNISYNSSLGEFTGSSSVGSLVTTVRAGANYSVRINTSVGYVSLLSSVSTSAHNFSVNAPNFTIVSTPSSASETDQLYFAISVPQNDDSQYGFINLFFNGTSYNMTKTGVGNSFLYERYLVAPSVNVAGSFTYNFSFTVNNFLHKTNSFSLSVTDASISLCTLPSGSGNVSLNFTIFDENNVTIRLNADLEADILIYGSDRANGVQFNFIGTGSSSYLICLYPSNLSIQADAVFKYTVPTGFTHFYFLNNATLTNITNHINAYNYNGTTGTSDLKGTVRLGSNYQPMQNVFASMERHYIGEGVWRVVQMDQSGVFGTIFFNIIEQTTEYRFVFRDNNNTLIKSTGTVKFVCESGICEPIFLLNPGEAAATPNEAGFSASMNNATGIVTVNFNDPTGLTQQVRVIVSKETMTDHIVICDNSLSSASGTITCNVSQYSGSAIVQAYVTDSTGTSADYTSFIYIGGQRLSDVLTVGASAFWTVGLLLVIFGASLYSPMASIFSFLFGVIFIAAMGLFPPFTYGVAAIVAVLGVVVGISVRDES